MLLNLQSMGASCICLRNRSLQQRSYFLQPFGKTSDNMVENMLDQAFKKLNPHEHPFCTLTRDGSIV